MIALVFQMPMGPPSQYLTLRYVPLFGCSLWLHRALTDRGNSLKGLGFTTFQTNLLIIPTYTLSMINLLFFTLFAGWTKQLAFNGIIGQIWALPCLVALYATNTVTENKWIVFAITTILLAYPSNHSVQVGK